MITVKDIFEFLNDKFPVETASDFDNPGLLVGNKNTIVTKALVALDCDANAVKTASENGCELIITHHPVIFTPLKNITAGSIVYELIKSDIAVVSMHTNLDIAKGGVNDCLCKKLLLKNVKTFTADDGFVIRSAKSDVSNPDELAEQIRQALGYSVRYVGGRKIQNVLVCSGSGGDFLRETIREGFDALITAEVKHNVFVDAVNNGVSVFDCGHYASEAVVIEPLCETLSEEFEECEFLPYLSESYKFI